MTAETEHESASFSYSENHTSEAPPITTFYSFKGGVGRTMALYNVAARLTALRRKVLMVDVDLEAPGLSIGVLDERVRRQKEGFAEIASDLLLDLGAALGMNLRNDSSGNSSDSDWRKTGGHGDPEHFCRLIGEYKERVNRSLHVVDSPLPPRHQDLAERLQETFSFVSIGKGALFLLSTGRIDPEYPQKMVRLPLDEAFGLTLDGKRQEWVEIFLEEYGKPLDTGLPENLGQFFTVVFRELLRAAVVPEGESNFDHILLDARSGLADVGGLCLRGLANNRVVLSGLNRQNLAGTRMVLDTLPEPERASDRLVVVFSPVPEGEVDLLDERLKDATQTLDVDPDKVRTLHYHPRLALEEKAFAKSVHRHTRIFDEYESLTDRVLELTGKSARNLINKALNIFREPPKKQEELQTRYRAYIRGLVEPAFIDRQQVRSLVQGLCTHIYREEESDPSFVELFKFWIALAPDSIEVLGNSANYFTQVAGEVWDEDIKEAILLYDRASEYYAQIGEIKPDDLLVWYNWGNSLSGLSERLWDIGRREAAAARYEEAFEKYKQAVEIEPDMHKAWYNWGNSLGEMARRLWDGGEPDEAAARYEEAFEKYARAVEIEPEMYEAWYNWGTDLGTLARRLLKEDREDEARKVLEQSIDKLQKARRIQEHPLTLLSLARALVLRQRDDDINQAEKIIHSVVQTHSDLAQVISDDEVLCNIPELNAIIESALEQADSTSMDQDSDEMEADDLITE